MKRQLAGGTVFALLFQGIALAQSPPATATAPPLAAKGEAITITGCVLAGSDDRSLVLTHVSEGSATAATPKEMWLGAEGIELPREPGGKVAYWLNKESVKSVRTHIGHRVEIKGRVTNISQGTVKIEQEPGKDGRDNKVEIEARGKEAEAKTEKPVTGAPTAAGSHSKTETSMPVHRIHVDSVRMLAPTCP